MDGFVKVWDTNTLGVVLEFDFKDKVRVREEHGNYTFGCYVWHVASHVVA